MSTLARGAFAATLVALLVDPVAGFSSDACSRDALTVDGKAVEVTLCVPGGEPRKGRTDGHPVSVTITEVFSSGPAAFTRTAQLDFLDQSAVSRTIDDVALERLGIAKTLHLTIGYGAGSVHLEHAMLIPGAVSLK